MAITISGANNVDKILATDGVLDSISGFNVVGVMTAANFDVTGKTTTGHLNVGSDIQIGNAGIITATTLVGNVQGNINHTSNLLLQISGSEKFRVGTSGQLGIGGANYGSSGQVLTSGGSGSAATWSTISGTTINNNAANKVIMGSNTANTLEAVAKSSLFSQINHGQSFLDDNYLIFGDASDLQLVHQSSGAKARIRNTNDSGSLDIESTLTRFLNKDGSTEKLRIGSSGQIGIAGANYGSSGQVLTSGGSGSAVSWTTISSDLVSDTSPQLGGDLASNGSDIKFANNDKAIFGTGNDAAIYHNDTDFHIDAQASGATRGIYITAGTVSSPFITLRTDNGEDMLKCLPDDGVFLYHNGNLKLRTTSAGTELRGDVHFDNHTNTGKDIYWDESNDRLSFNDSVHATFGNGEDLRIFHDGTTNHIKGTGSHSTMFWTSNVERWYIDSNGHFKPGANGNYDIGASNARVRNIYISDLNLSNEGQSNDVDGTWGDWTLQEGEHKIYMINNRTGKKYSLKMEEE